jgi:hypothetical protein
MLLRPNLSLTCVTIAAMAAGAFPSFCRASDASEAPDGFTCWMMGSGITGGTSFGATDDFRRETMTSNVARVLRYKGRSADL